MVPMWCLYDKSRRAVHNGLTYQEARAIVRVLGPEERLAWYAWKEGWANWKVLNHAAELVATMTDVKKTIEAPPLPQDSQSDDLNQQRLFNADSGVNLADSFVNAPVQEKEEDERKIERIEGELSVEIICGGRKFYSVTRDISIKGVQLKDSAPEWMAGYCTLILSRPEVEQNLEFVCSVVENQELGKKFRFEIQPSKDTLHLKRWLLDLHLKSIKKSTG